MSAFVAVVSLLTACSDEPVEDSADSGAGADREPSIERTSDLAAAESRTREDSVYPEAGDPLVDALHYDLTLAWTPETDHLDATERLTFRATAGAPRFRLDFDDALTIDSLTVDGGTVDFRHADKNLVVEHRVSADRRYVVELAYSGTPEAYSAPSGDDVGWTVTAEHETWTVQQPYGAFTWYAVNDQPSDKAFYAFTLTVPEPWTGVANGELLETTENDGSRTTEWRLAEPAAAYLVTVAFGDYAPEELESPSGVPITLWLPTDEPAAAGEATYAPEALDWLEQHLGPYPFDTLGILIVDGDVAMETQTMVTLGKYTTSRTLVVHELAHSWYGDTVGPADWSDVWMSEGWATYLHAMWEAEEEGVPLEVTVDEWAGVERTSRLRSGPPADYDPARFGDDNIYYGPALMLHELREALGNDTFLELAREWPERRENSTVDREEYMAWLEQETGRELSAFLEAWLLGRRTPDRRATIGSATSR